MKIFQAGSSLSAAALALGLLLPAAATGDVQIEHDRLKKIKSGVRAELSSEISAKGTDAQVRDARAYFKTRPANRFYFVPLNAGGRDEYSGVLPAMAAGTESFDYFILARGGDDGIVKTETWTVKVEDDSKVLARMEQKPPRELKIDVDQLEEARDLVEESRQVTDAERSTVARRGGEPDPSERVEVRTESTEAPRQLAGIDDYVNLRFVGPADVVSSSAIDSATTVSAGGGGIGGAALGGIAVAGAVGAAAAAGGGGGDGSGGGGGSSAAAACNSQQVAGADAPELRTIELGRTSGSFVFQFDTFFQQDRMAVVYQGSVLFDTGCVGASGARTLTYSGSSSQVNVAVQPNCAGGSGTRWEFTVNCP